MASFSVLVIISKWFELTITQLNCIKYSLLLNFKNLLPGFCQGITRVTISYPFDVIKINMQKLIFKNTIESITHIYKNDPYKFYRGSFLSYTSVSLERSIQFYFLEKMNKQNS